MKKLIYTLLFLVLSLISYSQQYYVSPTGNDSNDGSAADDDHAWLTIPNFYNTGGRISAGDTVNVLAGTYNQKVRFYNFSGGDEDNVTLIRAYNDANVIIDGTGFDIWEGGALVMSNSSYIKFYGLTIRNINMTGYEYSMSAVVFNGDAKHNEMVNCTVYNCWGAGIGVGADSCLVDSCLVYNCCENNNRDEGRNLEQTESWGSGISARRYPTGVTIRNCIVHDVWGEGISTFEAEYTTIEDNVIYDVSSAMLYCSDSRYCLLQRNFVYTTRDMGTLQLGLAYWDERDLVEDVYNKNNILINNIVYGCYRNFRISSSNPLTEGTLIAFNTFVNSREIANVDMLSVVHTGGEFKNNIIIQEDGLPCIRATNSYDLVYSNNLYNKSYDSDAVGANDVIDSDNIIKTGTYTDTSYYRLVSESNGIDAGIALDTVDVDYEGTARDDPPDIGALEYAEQNPAVAPTVVTGQVYNVSKTSCSVIGNTTDDGGDIISQKGVCWSTNLNPTTADDKTEEGGGAGEFSSDITGLNENTTYHVRAYSINGVDTSYGEDKEFKTLKSGYISNGGNVLWFNGKIIYY